MTPAEREVREVREARKSWTCELAVAAKIRRGEAGEIGRPTARLEHRAWCRLLAAWQRRDEEACALAARVVFRSEEVRRGS